MPIKRIPLTTFFLLTLLATNAIADESGLRPLRAAMQDAVATTKGGLAVERCEKAFREYVVETSRAIENTLHGPNQDQIAVLWVVAEDGRISSTRMAKPDSRGRLISSFRSDDLSDDKELDAAKAKAFYTTWHEIMTGKITEVRDVADGSCTLAYDGKQARLFLPGQGIAAGTNDALETALNLLDDSQ